MRCTYSLLDWMEQLYGIVSPEHSMSLLETFLSNGAKVTKAGQHNNINIYLGDFKQHIDLQLEYRHGPVGLESIVPNLCRMQS